MTDIRTGTLKVGDIIDDSPVGSGSITGFTERGYPQVNHIAVGWLFTENGLLFNPHDHSDINDKYSPV
jgi:hypothetical protein